MKTTTIESKLATSRMDEQMLDQRYDPVQSIESSSTKSETTTTCQSPLISTINILPDIFQQMQQQQQQHYIQDIGSLLSSALAQVVAAEGQSVALPAVITPSLLLEKPKSQLTNEEKRQRRLLRNRAAAKECRKKKKLQIHEMEDKITRLQNENSKLRKQVEELREKVASVDTFPLNFTANADSSNQNAEKEI